MLILGIESSCDETAAAVLYGDKSTVTIVSSIVASQIDIHKATGGVVPEVAARAHVEQIIPVIHKALQKAKITLQNIDAIAVTAGPGLMTSLMVGVDTARALAAALQKPIIAVNHMEAHVFSPFIPSTTYKLQPTSSVFPALSLVVSGGHTELVLVHDFLKYKKIGATVDDAAGETFDKTAKLIGLSYPGGPALSKLAKKGKPIINFPRPMIGSSDFNFSFSGLKTAVLYYLRDKRIVNSEQGIVKKQRGAIRYSLFADVAASVQTAIVDVLVSKTEAAARKYKVKTIMLAGGVAANSLLRSRLQATSYKLPASPAGGQANFLAAQPQYCTDNAAMIAFAGYLHARKKQFTPLTLVKADPSWELD